MTKKFNSSFDNIGKKNYSTDLKKALNYSLKNSNFYKKKIFRVKTR